MRGKAVNMDINFFDWTSLGTIAGAVFAVAVVTQITKHIPGINKLPTQLWSYLLAACVLLLSQAFTDGLTAASAVLCIINAALVSLAANGGYAAIKRIQSGVEEKPPEE